MNKLLCLGRSQAAQLVSRSKHMVSHKNVTDDRSYNAHPNKHVVSVDSNTVPSAIHPAPDLQGQSVMLTPSKGELTVASP